MTAGPVRKRLVVNAVLAGGALVLGLLLWLNPGDRHQAPSPISNLEKKRIETIRIERYGEPTVVLDKHGAHWRMLEPFSTAADDLRVGSVVNVLRADSYAHYALEGRDPAEFGLEPPRVMLHLNDLRLEFGGTDPLENRRYLLLDDTLHLVDDTVLPLLTGGAAMLVDRHVVPRDANIIRLAAPRLTAGRSADGAWRTDPDNAIDDTDALEKWIAQWQNAESLEVQYRPDVPAGASANVRVVPEDHAPLQYTVIRNENEQGLYRAETGLIYRFDQGVLDKLINPTETRQ